MKKYLILAAFAAVALGACTKIETTQVTVDEPLSFGAYTGKALTKAGAYGELTNTALQAGFGVFAYQTTGATAIATPNFMYNQEVAYTDTDGDSTPDAWTYSPIKYWPNQIQAGNTDGQPATAYQADKVSFFAYAPYVAATASTGAVASTNEGIIALTSNATSGDPKVTYKVSDDLNEQVDLCWGVAYANSDAASVNWATVAGTNVSLAPGFPFLGLQKPAIDTPIHFYFRHALAQINLSAIAAFNQVSSGGTAQDNVKITIKEVELSVPGMTDKAVLNLNNEAKNTPKWEAADGATTNNTLSLTVAQSNINTALRYQGAQVQTNAGVIGTDVTPVIVDNKYYTVIPTNNSTTITVKVTYYVTTPDGSLATGYSQVENVISRNVTFSSGLVAGTKNTIKMILGISEVKFEAEVSEWVTGGEQTVDLPKNVA